MKTLLLALTSITASALAQIALKSGMDRISTSGGAFDVLLSAVRSPLVLTGFALYGAGAVVWLLVLADWDLSKAYPVVGLGFVLTTTLAFVALGESVGPARVLGIVMVLFGILLVLRT